jgi:outer membrane receptor protein involved in Fe transport
MKSSWFISTLVVVMICNNAAIGLTEQSAKALLMMTLEELSSLAITTASKTSERITHTPAAMIVVSREQIRARRYVSLLDLLRDLPGVDIQARTHNTSNNEILLRGHNGSKTMLILQNGVRIDSPTGENIPIDNNFPLYHAKQVEILYGPASALYGADAFGGVINIITEEGADVNGVRLSSAYGSDNYHYHNAYAGAKFGALDVLMGAHIHRDDGPNMSKAYPDVYPKVDAVDFSGNVVVPAAQREDVIIPERSSSAFAKLTFQEKLTLGFNQSNFRNLTSVGLLPEVGLFLEDSFWDTHLLHTYGQYQHDFSTRLSGTTTLVYAEYEVDPASRFKDMYGDFQNSYTYVKGRKQGIEQQFNYTVSDKHGLVGGLSYENFYALPRITNLPLPYDADVSQYYRNTTIAIPVLDVSYHNHAAYLQWQGKWRDNLSTSAGLRYDENSRYGGALNPRLGVVYKPSAALVLKALYGQAFRAPSPLDNLLNFGAFTPQQTPNGDYVSYFFHVPNRDLKPEESDDYQLGLSYRFNDNFKLDLSGYYSEVHNLIVSQITDTPIQFLDGGFIYNTRQYHNLGRERHYGGELVLSYQRDLGAAWQLDSWGSYSYIDGDVRYRSDSIDVELPLIAQHKVRLGATLTYRDQYFATLKLRLNGDTTTTTIDRQQPSQRLTSRAYGVADLHLGARELIAGLALNLDIYNLFDTRYYNASGGGATLEEVPQERRALVLSLNYAF